MEISIQISTDYVFNGCKSVIKLMIKYLINHYEYASKAEEYIQDILGGKIKQ